MERLTTMFSASACASPSLSPLPRHCFNPLVSAAASSPRRWPPCDPSRRTSPLLKSRSNADPSSSALSSPDEEAAEPSATATAVATSSNGSDSDRNLLLSSAIDSPPFSLINYANIKKAFTGEPLLTPDHYATLELTPDATYAEVESAFKQKCESVLQQGLNEDEIRTKLRILKISYDILSSEEERRLYDWSLYNSQNPGVYRWPHESDITQSTYGPVPEEEIVEDEGIRQFGYFFLGWFLLSVVLSIALIT